MVPCYWTKLIFATLFYFTSAVPKEAPRHVWVVVNGRADLPCPHKPKHAHDKPTLVLWYRSSETLPIYSYDARSGTFTSGTRWTDEAVLGGRAFFTTGTNPPMLVLEPTRSHDQGVYTCRVDYRVSPSTTAVVNLTVVIPAGQPTIYWKGHTMVDTIGPLKEEARAKLTCRSSGGRPPPELSWNIGDQVISIVSAKSVSDPTTDTYWSESTVTVTAHRPLQGTSISCIAKTPTDDLAYQRVVCQPKVTYVTMNITLPPLDVSILGPEEVQVSAGTNLTLKCRSLGSHPPATLTWWKGHVALRNHVSVSVAHDRNMSTAALTIGVTKNQNGATLSCIANNPSIAHESITRTVKLEVFYLPEVKLRLGQPLEPDNIKEGDDVYFECSIISNPKYHRVDWFHDDLPVEHNVSAGVVVSGLSLVMRSLNPYHSGSYTCGAANQEGFSKSNQVTLTVRHAPLCVGDVVERVQGASRGALTSIQCKVLAEPKSNISWIWMRMRTDGTEEEITDDRIQNTGLVSSVMVTPLRQEDYGRFMCRATNAVGGQRRPCVINLVPAGPPDIVTNCSAEPITPDVEGVVDRDEGFEVQAGGDEEEEIHDAALAISCMAGFDGGLPQYFIMEAWQEKSLVANTSSDVPIWFVSGLKSGVGVTLKITSHNSRGRSEVRRMEVHTAIAKHRADSEETDGGFFEIPPVLGGIVGVGGILLLLLIAGAVVAKFAQPRKTPTHVHTLVMTSNDGGRTGKKPGIFDPDVVTSLRRHTDSLDVLPRTVSTQRSTATQVQGQRQAFIQTNGQGKTVTRAYVHKQNNKNSSTSRGFCIRRQGSPFSDSDSDDSDDSDSDSTFTDLTAAGRATTDPTLTHCKSNSLPRTNSRTNHAISKSCNSHLRCCQGRQLLSSSEGRLHQMSHVQPSASSTGGIQHIASSTGELHQVFSSTGELQHLIATGGVQHVSSNGEVHHLTSATGTLQQLRTTSREVNQFPVASQLPMHLPSNQDTQYPRSSSLDGLHTFVYSDELQRFLTSRELCQISYSEKCFPFLPTTSLWGAMSNANESIPLQGHLSYPSTSQQTLSSSVSVHPMSSQHTLSSTMSVQPLSSQQTLSSPVRVQPISSSMDIDQPVAFTEVRPAVSNIKLSHYPDSSYTGHPPSKFQHHSTISQTSIPLPESLPLNNLHTLQQTNMKLQDCANNDHTFLCEKLLPPPSFREPHQKSPTEEIPISMQSKVSSEPFTLFSNVPYTMPGSVQPSTSFAALKQQLPMSIELKSLNVSQTIIPENHSETTLANTIITSSTSCGELDVKSVFENFNASQINQKINTRIPESGDKHEKFSIPPREKKLSSPSSILRSPKNRSRRSFLDKSLNALATIPRPLSNRANKPSVRFCDNLISSGARRKSISSGTHNGSGLRSDVKVTKQVSFAEDGNEKSVLARRDSKEETGNSTNNSKRCGQLFSSDVYDFENKNTASDTASKGASPSSKTNDSEIIDAAFKDLLSNDITQLEFSSPEKTNASTPTKPPRGTNPLYSLKLEKQHSLSPKPSFSNICNEKHKQIPDQTESHSS